MTLRLLQGGTALLVAIAMATAAYVDHVYKPHMPSESLAVYEKAYWYLLAHSIFIYTISVSGWPHKSYFMAAYFISMILFSGSLYAKVFFGWPASLAPLGGSGLILTWLALGIYRLGGW